ncbi:MAG: ATP-binding protein [Pseudomonadales bacterium]|nr:ATP-binding protein [Pseudomonadales bacterium]
MDKYEKRWLGLKAYEESESEIFFGRKVEAEQICRMVERTTLCTIFAPAGTGKTSLLRAGVFPKLRQRNFFPLRIRLDHQSEDADHCKQIRDTLIVEAEKAGLEVGSVVPAQFDENEETLWEFLHRIELWDKHNQLITPVIVLDQFEEFFTLGQNNPKSLDFLTVLSDLIERRVPQQLRANLNKKGERRKIPTNAQWFKIIISMREDFVAKLDSIRRSMPSIMNNRFPLKSLNGEQALEIIMQPGRDIVEEETARKIVNIAAKNQDESGKAEVALEQLTVEASLLSLLCYELDRQRIKQGEQLINDNQDSLKAASADILRKFYIESFNAIQPIEERDKAFKVVEEQLLTKNGYRRRESLDDAEHGGLSKQACDHLIDQHVLKKIPTGNELEYIELTHDLLTDVVKESRDKRREEEKRQKLEEIRKTQRTRPQLFFMFSIVLLVTTLYSFYLSHRAQQAELKSEQMYYFMTNGLYDQLLSAGRLDMLDPVVGSAYRHFDIEKKGSQTDYSDEKWSSNGEAKYRTLSNIADVLARKGDIGESLEMYQAANKLGEDIARNIANSFESDKDSSRAAFYEKYIDTKISYASLVAKWSDTGLADQLLREATDNLNRLEKNHYLGKRIAIVSAEISLQKGFFDQAIQILDVVMNRSSDESVSTFGKILDAVGYRVQAKAYSGLNIYSKALEASLNSLKILDQLTKKDSTNDEWLYEKLDSLKEQGTLHIAIGDFEGAKDKLIPALAMAKKKNSQLKQLRVDADAHSQWYYLQINITLDLVKLWYRYSASNHLTADEKKRALKTSFQYWKTLQKFVTDDASVHKADSYLIKKAQLAWLAASCDLLPHYSDEPDKEQVLFRACFSKGQGNNLFELAKAKKNRMFPSIIVLYGDLLKSRIASEKYPRAKEKARLAEIEAAISFFKHVRSEFSDNQLAKKYLIDFYQLLAAEHSKKGKSKLAVAELNNALNLAGSALEAEYTEAFARRKADILMLLADEQSRGITESLDKIVNLYNDAYQLYSNLYTTRYGSSETGAFLRLEDRLTAAKVQYKLSKIFRASSGDKDEEAIRSLELASQGGLREASEELALILKETDKEQSSRYEILQNKQRRKQLMVPCLFKDKVIGDRITEVRRLVYAKIWIVGGDITTENSNEGIELEKKRLAYDYGLNFVSEMDTALENRVRVVNSNSESDPELSLAAITDNTFVEQLELASVKERNDTIELRSPVASNYPKTTPTVIGNDILFSWDFQGTANNRRDYRLQVSTDKTFEAESIFIDEEVSGTQFRYDFSVDEDKTGLNRELYWRVRNIAGSPGLNEKDADDSDWSQVRAVEVYQSIWDRILYTGEVRLGVSQFEGDALGVDESDPDKLAKFDGQVLEYIKKQLNEQWKQDRTEIMHLLSPKAAAIEELSYNIASYGWVGMFEAVAKNQVDISASTITRTKDRSACSVSSFQSLTTKPVWLYFLKKVSCQLNPMKISRTLSWLLTRNFVVPKLDVYWWALI